MFLKVPLHLPFESYWNHGPIIIHLCVYCLLLLIIFGVHPITRYHIVALHINDPPEFKSLHPRTNPDADVK